MGQAQPAMVHSVLLPYRRLNRRPWHSRGIDVRKRPPSISYSHACVDFSFCRRLSDYLQDLSTYSLQTALALSSVERSNPGTPHIISNTLLLSSVTLLSSESRYG